MMPYFMRQSGDKWCVYHGTKENPGDVMHCYTGDDARTRARKYLAALYMHVEDVKDDHTYVIISYKEVSEASIRYPITADRWIAVSTVAMWDLDGEMFTTEAMDKDIARAKATDEYPELRLMHVRGFKIGKCDRMTRVGRYAADYGYWYDTPLANAVKDLVINNDGKWRISRGFFPVKAAGECPECGTRLTVGPVHFWVGLRCAKCGATQPSPLKLKQLVFTDTKTYDISVTDVPIVPKTAVTAYMVSPDYNKESNIMALSKDQWRERLVKAGIPEDVVDATLKEMTDEDLSRMKDVEGMTPQQLADALKITEVLEQAKQAEKKCPKCGAVLGEGDKKCKACGAVVPEEAEEEKAKTKEIDGAEEIVDMTDAFNSFAAQLKKDLTEHIDGLMAKQELEVELPALTDIQAAIESLRTDIASLKDAVSQLLKDDADKIAEVVEDLSPASRARLVVHQKTAAVSLDEANKIAANVGTWFNKPAAPGEAPIVMDAHGNKYATLQDMAMGTPIK